MGWVRRSVSFAKRNITFDGRVNIDAPNIGLTAQAGNDIVVNNLVATGGGAIVLSANDNGFGTASGSGKVIINAGGSVDALGGSVTIKDSTTMHTPPPSADICKIAPDSALCQVLSPPTASEPNKPVQQASNEVIKTLTTSTPNSSGGSSTSASVDDTKKADDKKSDTKEVASNDKSGTKNDTVKKLYCN